MTTEPEATQNTPDVSIKSDATDETKSFWLKNALARLRSVGDSTRARLHMRFPNIECLEETSIRQHIQNRDIRDNGETQIGESEEAKIRALWGVELYGPSEIESLYSSLRRLGWDRDRLRQQNNSPENWIAQQRMYGSFGNLNLGNIQRQGDSRRFLVDRFAPMPDSVDYMHGYVYQASPSLTAIILCFILKSEHTGELETILQKDRKTRNERGWRSRGYRIIGPFHAKERDIKATRAQNHNLVSQWFNENIPGFFSARDSGSRLPTAELLTTRWQQLLRSPRDRTAVPKWVQLIGKMGLSEVWRLAGSEAISLTWDMSENKGQLHTLVNLRTEHLSEKELEHYQGKNTGSYVALASTQVEGALVHLGVLAGLLEIQRGLRVARDTFPTASHSSRQTLRAIQKIKSFFSSSLGLPTIAAEILSHSENEHYFRWSCERFTSEPWRDDEKPEEITTALMNRTSFVARRLAAQEKETREHFEQMSAVLNTQEAIRTQRRMEVLTVVATLLTGASLLVALLSIEAFAQFLQNFIEPYLESK